MASNHVTRPGRQAAIGTRRPRLGHRPLGQSDHSDRGWRAPACRRLGIPSSRAGPLRAGHPPANGPRRRILPPRQPDLRTHGRSRGTPPDRSWNSPGSFLTAARRAAGKAAILTPHGKRFPVVGLPLRGQEMGNFRCMKDGKPACAKHVGSLSRHPGDPSVLRRSLQTKVRPP